MSDQICPCGCPSHRACRQYLGEINAIRFEERGEVWCVDCGMRSQVGGRSPARKLKSEWFCSSCFFAELRRVRLASDRRMKELRYHLALFEDPDLRSELDRLEARRMDSRLRRNEKARNRYRANREFRKLIPMPAKPEREAFVGARVA